MDPTHQFKPALLVLVVTLATGATTLVRTPAVASGPAATAEFDALTAEMLTRLNHERSAAGAPALMLSDEANAVARARAWDMAAAGYFAHVSRSGSNAARLLAEHGVAYRLMGENIARSGQPIWSAVDVVCATLMASEAHRANMLDADFGRVGIGIAAGDSMLYFTLVFLD